MHTYNLLKTINVPLSYSFFVTVFVDLFPFVGPPAWTAIVFIQMKYSLNIWGAVTVGVMGSTMGRYLLSRYIPLLSTRFINRRKKEDIEFIGTKLSDKSKYVQLFVLIYTLIPLPSTPLFTAAGIARVKPINFIPAFFIGKFVSDMIMVLISNYTVENSIIIAEGALSWESIFGSTIGLIMVICFLCIDWRALLQEKK